MPIESREWPPPARRPLHDGHDPAEVERRGLHAVDCCPSAALLVGASTWDDAGGMDDRLFPAGHVDQDLAMRMRGQGRLVLCEPRARTLHVRGAGRSQRYKRFTGTAAWSSSTSAGAKS